MTRNILRIQLVAWLFTSLAAAAAELQTVLLPPAQTDGGRPLMQVLKDRKTVREFSTNSLSVQTLANLLWAGFGTNRADGHRTAPSAMNSQEVDIYVALRDGTYVYDAPRHELRPVAAGDIRTKTGGQDFTKA